MADEELTELSPIERARRVAKDIYSRIPEAMAQYEDPMASQSPISKSYSPEGEQMVRDMALGPIADVRDIAKGIYERDPVLAGLGTVGLTGIPAKEIAKGAKAAFKALKPGQKVDGREVIFSDAPPNMDSIEASFSDYNVQPGLQEVSMLEFPGLTGKHYSVAGTKRIKELAGEIEESNTISPLIVAIDDEGPYILEGATRAEALYRLGAKSFPAKVVDVTTKGVKTASKAVTETPAFKKFFGDSKVVDEAGDPLVVYHGTTHDFDEFSGDSYFTSEPRLANKYADARTFQGVTTAPTGSRIIPVYLRMKNPLIIDGDSPEVRKIARVGPDRDVHVGDIRSWAMRQMKPEHDGIIFRDVADTPQSFDPYGTMRFPEIGDVYFVPSPTQVKSASGNIGTFDLNDPRISYGIGAGAIGAGAASRSARDDDEEPETM